MSLLYCKFLAFCESLLKPALSAAIDAASRPLPGEDGDLSSLPLCVDLDQTLLRTDMFAEQLVAASLHPRALADTIAAAWRGRAHLKHYLAARSEFDPENLPYNTELLDWLRTERERGRTVVLATAADRIVATRIARHLNVFSEVLASDGETNLKGARKAAKLVERFGEGGFAYAGDSSADLPIWKVAGSAVLVGATNSVARTASEVVRVERVFSLEPRLRGAVRALRVGQWIKNVLIFMPTVLSRSYGNVSVWMVLATMFAAFCALASSVYLVNDMLDVRSDRAHPTKRDRPLASGRLAPSLAVVMAAVLMVTGLVLATLSGGLVPAACYLALTFAYSTFLKELQLVDIFALAGLYSIRLVAGGTVSGHTVSDWLLAFSGFLFLALALMKRAAELRARSADGGSANKRRAYHASDLVFLETLGIGSSLTSTVVLALFVQSSTSISHPLMLMAVVPAVLFWQTRLWLSTSRGYMLEDPIVYAAKDWVTRLVGVVIAAAFVISGSGIWR